jgi:hypothetical protein
MPSLDEPQLAIAALVGVVAGLVLLVQGLTAYRQQARIGDIGSSRISSLAAGEVRVSGSVVEAGVALLSPLQSERCVYYRAQVDERSGDDDSTILREERAVGFFVDDGSGRIRVFPRGARWSMDWRFDEHDDWGSDLPAGLRPRGGSALTPAAEDRQAQIAALLTVRRPDGESESVLEAMTPSLSRRRTYREARLEAGETVTILGTALPFQHLDDPDGADLGEPALTADDPELAADIAEARAAGRLLGTAAEAWGNAAIPGFGIARPVSTPVLDPGANALPPAEPGTAERVRETFEIEPDTLVLASLDDSLLLVYAGDPGAAAGREQGRVILGLVGALLAIVSALALALVLSGGLTLAAFAVFTAFAASGT